MRELEGARAVVTGGTRGIGAATVERFSSAGAIVVAVARTEAPVPKGVRLITADLATESGASHAATASLELLGGVDVLVDNAGRNIQVPDGPLAATEDLWTANLDANLLSAVRLDRVLVPVMVAQGHGVVIHVSSGAAVWPQPNGVLYSAAKAALNAYSKGLAGSVGKQGVRVVVVAPGVIETEGVRDVLMRAAERSGRGIEDERRALGERLAAPMGRAGTAEEVADLISFLVSTRASYLTGNRIVIDGGLMPTT